MRELLSSPCLRVTMNQWFSHGETFKSVLPAEDCCSACMGKCKCDKCSLQLKQFEPLRKQMNVSKTQVRYISQLLSSLDINKKTPVGTPNYDADHLAEELVSNLLQFKNLERFREFLELFSLGDYISKALIQFVETNFEELVVTQVNRNTKTFVNYDVESESSNPSDCSRNVVLLFF